MNYISNYVYITHKEFLALCDARYVNNLQAAMKCFIRFLKDKRVYNKYKKLFNNKTSGIYYREIINFKFGNCDAKSLQSFLSSSRWQNYIITAFQWGESDYWRNVHNEWMIYFNEQIKLGLI